ncbi:hypothetical protein ACF08N_01245 [Streptomyces sp. NPDC015127]|uniref:hypothetical protein n=1 Tax=Streptomyces sp. NPDC015127 TaxID=3364939 RepID=UPI003703361F
MTDTGPVPARLSRTTRVLLTATLLVGAAGYAATEYLTSTTPTATPPSPYAPAARPPDCTVPEDNPVKCTLVDGECEPYDDSLSLSPVPGARPPVIPPPLPTGLATMGTEVVQRVCARGVVVEREKG